MLLRNNRQLALNEVESLCLASQDHYAAAVGKTADPELIRVFSDLAEQRGQFAAELAEHIRALDDLPQSPDPDMEAVDHLVSSVKALFSTDERGAVIDEREQFEHKFADALRAALQQDLPEDTKALLDRMTGHVEDAIARLEEMRAEAQGDGR